MNEIMRMAKLMKVKDKSKKHKIKNTLKRIDKVINGMFFPEWSK